MPFVNLTTVGNFHPKGTGSVKLADIVVNPYSRTHSVAGYARQNPFEEDKGHTPTEDAAPHSLNDFESYSHLDIENGVDLEVTVGYLEVRLDWVKHAGYANAPGLLRHLAYFRSMGTSEDLSENPFSGSFDDAGDDDFVVLAGLSAGDFYALGVKVEFDDSEALELTSDSVACTPKSGQQILTGAGEGISSFVAVFADTPSLDGYDQDPAPGDCFIGCSGSACPDLTIDCTMDGPSTGRLERSTTSSSGPWSLIDASVTAGSTALTFDDHAQGNFWFRMRYNDVSPDAWSSSIAVEVSCELV